MSNAQGGRPFEEQPLVNESKENRQLKEVVGDERVANAGQARRRENEHELLKAKCDERAEQAETENETDDDPERGAHAVGAILDVPDDEGDDREYQAETEPVNEQAHVGEQAADETEKYGN